MSPVTTPEREPVCQCIKTRGEWICALWAGHYGPCGNSPQQVRLYDKRDRRRSRLRLWSDRSPDNPVSPGNYRKNDHE